MDDLELQAEVYVRKMEFPDVNLTGGTFKLDLYAPDIRLLSQTLHSEQLSIFSGGGMEIPLEIPVDMSAGGTLETTINNAGDTGAFPFIVINGAIEDPTISNQTTGDSFSIDYTLTTTDERIEVDVENRSVLYYADDTASGVNIRDKFSGDWFEIAQGNNSIKLVVADTSDSGNATIRWRDAFLGV
jgi:phage-related protein